MSARFLGSAPGVARKATVFAVIWRRYFPTEQTSWHNVQWQEAIQPRFHNGPAPNGESDTLDLWTALSGIGDEKPTPASTGVV